MSGDSDLKKLKKFQSICGGQWRMVNGAYVSDKVEFGPECHVVGGVYVGGTFYSGWFYGGCFYGGEFERATIYDGYFVDGRFADTCIRGGEFYGGEFCGAIIYAGEYHGGAWNGSPIQVVTKSGYVVSESDNGHITIGGIRKTINEWQEYGDLVVCEHGVIDVIDEIQHEFDLVVQSMVAAGKYEEKCDAR